MDNSINEEENPITNFDEKTTKSNHTALMIIITIVTLLLALFGKLITIGWLTVLLTWCMIMPAHFILFATAGIRLACLKDKSKKDYICFAVLCSTMLIYAFTFVDVGDTSSNKAIYFISDNTLYHISLLSFCINIISIIFATKRCKDR